MDTRITRGQSLIRPTFKTKDPPTYETAKLEMLESIRNCIEAETQVLTDLFVTQRETNRILRRIDRRLK